MVDEQKLVTEPVEPVLVTMIGTGTGTGAPITNGTTAVTPDHMPNVIVRVVSPVVAVAIRFAHAYLTTLLGLVTVGLTTDALPAADFVHLVQRCAELSLAGPGVALGKDLLTLLGDLEKKYPLLTGSV